VVAVLVAAMLAAVGLSFVTSGSVTPRSRGGGGGGGGGDDGAEQVVDAGGLASQGTFGTEGLVVPPAAATLDGVGTGGNDQTAAIRVDDMAPQEERSRPEPVRPVLAPSPRVTPREPDAATVAAADSKVRRAVDLLLEDGGYEDAWEILNANRGVASPGLLLELRSRVLRACSADNADLAARGQPTVACPRG